MEFAQLPTTRYTDANSDLIRAAGPQGFQAYDYIFSSAQVNYLGIYPINTRLAASQICMAETELLAYIEKFEATGLVRYDADNCLIWAVSAAVRSIGELKQNPGKKGDNRIKMANKAFAALPDRSPLKAAFFRKYAEMLKLKGAPAVALAKAMVPARAPQVASAPAVVAVSSLSEEPQPGEIDTSALNFKAASEALLDLRAQLRDDYPPSGDQVTRERIAQLRSELGAREASDLIIWAVQNDDLSLDYTMSSKLAPACAQADI